jgi:mono/diheme cytochrome c family protein
VRNQQLSSLVFWFPAAFVPVVGVFVCGIGGGDPGAASAASGRPKAVDAPVIGPRLQRAVRFETDVQPVLKLHCSRCHAGRSPEAELDLTSVEGVFRGSKSDRVVVPGKAEESLLFEVVREGRMPPDKKGPLSVAEIATIRQWIQSGAPTLAAHRAAARPAVAAVTQHDVLPILLVHCTVCHGARRREAGLDLRSRAAMLQGGKSGPALRPGRPDQSLMLKRIQAGQMPPFQQLMKAGVKPLTPAEAERLKQWIALGAPESPIEADVATTDPDRVVTDADRKFWAFQPPAPVSVPPTGHSAHRSENLPLNGPDDRFDRARNPVDAFILQKLDEKKLTFSPEADRLTLLRRAYVDLLGLLPEPEEIQACLADREPNAYERLIDRLLASPQYGERWSRYWLDIAGYADSDGHFGDTIRPFAYRYRDYVIRSFNADKPYDRFLLEQIAGDELVDYEHAATITPEIMENLVATGFLRLTPDGTNPPELNYVPERLEVIADEMEVFGSSVLGLTIKCARCHDHKYDPIPQRDYYRLVAVFKGAFDEYDWLRPAHRTLPQVTPDERKKPHEYNRPFREQIASLRAVLDLKAEALRRNYQDQVLARLPKALRGDLRLMLATPAKQRSAAQKRLAERYENSLRFDEAELKQRDPAFRKAAAETAAKVEALAEKMLPGAEIPALWDRGEPSPTYIYRQGDYLKPGRLVGPGVPSVLTDGRTPFVATPPWPGAHKTGRRRALAQWLNRSDHPLTARVMVNRIWKHHFGRGLVATLDNFGHTGARPTHPELLDWLSREFVSRGWSIKALHRLLMTSATYRQSSARSPEQEKRDPENRLLARMPLRRMEAEVVYDTLLQVAGRLDRRSFDVPDLVDVQPDGLVTPVGTERGWRRSIYVLQRRKQIPTVLESFDYPQMTPNCIERIPSTVATQALTLMNDALVRRLAHAFAQRVENEVGADAARQIERAYCIAVDRSPTQEERAIGLQALAQLTEMWAKNDGSGSRGQPGGDRPRSRALATYCHALLNSAAFLVID